MLCLRCSRGASAVRLSSIAPRAIQSSSLKVSAQRYSRSLSRISHQLMSCRTFTSLTQRRPTALPSCRPPLAISPSTVSTSAVADAPLDLLPKISTHPALSATQVRCGPRNTFNPSHFVRKRRHGFLSRIRTRKGRATLQRRRAKRRSTLSH